MYKILFVHNNSSVGGGSYCLLNLLKVIDRSIFNPIVLLKNNGPLVGEIEKLDIEVCFFPELVTAPYNNKIYKLGTWITFFQILLSKFFFNKIMDKINPEIVYLNNSLLYPYLKLVKHSGRKSIIHIREHWPMHKNTMLSKSLQYNIRAYANLIIAINSYSSKMVECNNVKPIIIHDWIDFSDRFEPFNPQEYIKNFNSKTKIYLYTGGMQAIKGFDEVISAH